MQLEIERDTTSDEVQNTTDGKPRLRPNPTGQAPAHEMNVFVWHLVKLGLNEQPPAAIGPHLHCSIDDVAKHNFQNIVTNLSILNTFSCAFGCA